MSIFRQVIPSLVAELARESVRTFAYGTLILSLLLPATPAPAATAPALPVSPLAAAEEEATGPSPVYDVRAVDKKLGRLAELSYEIDSPETPEYGRKILRKRANRLYETLQAEIGREMTEAEKSGKGENAPPEAAKRLKDAQDRWVQLQFHAQNARVDAHGRMLLNPSGGVSPQNVVDISVHAESATSQQLKEETPDRMRDRFKSWAATGYRGAMHFTNELAVFSLATGLHSMWQASMQHFGVEDVTDPMVFENWEKQTFNLLGAAGFALFMTGNHSVMHLYRHIKILVAERQISKQAAAMLVSYLGMTAGLFLQNLFSEFVTDKNVWDCLRPYHNSNATVVPQACEKMRDTWINQGRILNYWPSAVAMIGAAGISTLVRLGISLGRPVATQAGEKLALTAAGQAAVGLRRNLVASGVKVIHKSRLPEFLKLAKSTVGGKLLERETSALLHGVSRFAGGIGDLLFFLVVNDTVTDEFVKTRMQDFRMNQVDPNAWMMKHLSYHTDFFWPAAGTYQPLRNAFDAEATNTWGAHNYLMDLYRTMQKSGWQDPGSVEACAPKEVQEALAKAKANNKNDGKAHLLAKKSDQQLACEVLRQPKALLERYGKVNSEWRSILLEPFSRSVNNWVEMINQFYTVYAATQNMAVHLTKLKYKMIHNGETPPPDFLSRDSLMKVISPDATAAGGKEGGEGETGRKHNAFLDNTWVPTPELVDFVIAGFACGPDPQLDHKAMNRNFFSRFFNDFYSYFMRRTVSESYLTTPWGSSIHFVAPKLTNKSRAICENVGRDMYNTVNYMLGNPFPERDPKKPGVKNAFTGPFYDENNRKYDSLAEFVFTNMDPAIYQTRDGQSNFGRWWSDRFTDPMQDVWENYIKTYNGFVQHKYVPALFDRTYRGGCRQAEEMVKDVPKASAAELENFADSQPACANSSTAYRVANGYFLSIEFELKNYLRGLYSLYASTFDKAELTPQMKNQFMLIANELIRGVRTTKPQMFTPVDMASEEDKRLKIHVRTFDFQNTLEDAQRQADQLIELVAGRLKAKPENKFRTEMLEAFKSQISKLVTEQAGQLSVVKQIYMFDDNYSGPAKKLDTSPSVKPNKGGSR